MVALQTTLHRSLAHVIAPCDFPMWLPHVTAQMLRTKNQMTCMQTTLHRPAPLTVPGVFATLRKIAGEKGPGSAARRQRAILQLLRSCRDCETRYLIRTLVQVLALLLVSLSWQHRD